MRCLAYGLVFLVLISGSQTTLSADENHEPVTIRVGVYDNPPKVSMNENKNPEGIFIDIIKYIENNENLRVEYVEGDWIQLVDKLLRGEIDVLPDVAWSVERDSLFTLSTLPILNSWVEVYTRMGTGISSIADLNGKRIGVLEGSIQHEYLAELLMNDPNLNFEIIPFDDYTGTVTSLKKQKIDALVANRFFYYSELCDKKIFSTGEILQFTDLYFAFPKTGNPELVKLFDRNILALLNNPNSVYYDSLQRWLDKEDKGFIHRHFLWVLVIISSILLLVSAFAVLLRFQVRVKTSLLEQKNRELELSKGKAEESEQRYRGMVSIMPDGVLIHRDGIIQFANPAAAGIFKAGSVKNILGKKVLDFVHPDYREIVTERIRRSIHENLAVETIEETLVAADGSLVYAYVTAFPFFYEGRPSMLVIFTDITKLKLIEKELISAKVKAEESDKLKTVFLQNMSHEIRTPMNGIIGFLNLLREPAPEEEKKKFIDIVNKSGQRLLRTIDNLVELSKIESGQVSVNYSGVNLEEYMHFHLEFFIPAAREKGLQLQLMDHIRGEESFAESDRLMLDKILNHLLDNAIKFTELGRVEFGNYIEKNQVIVYVRDTGIGIPPDRIRAVFDRFVQADLNINRQYDGTGLGLSIARAYAEKLKGRIWVESDTAKGSVFFFSIPFTPLRQEKVNSGYIARDTGI